MHCPRCNGLLVGDEVVDLLQGFAHAGWRCLNCGHWDDPVVARQRVCPPAVVLDGRRLPRMVATGSVVLGS